MFSNADAIVAVSETGKTGTMLSSLRPACPIYLITANEQTYRQMAVEQNVYPILVSGEKDFSSLLAKGIESLKEKGLLKKDDTVVLSKGLKQMN